MDVACKNVVIIWFKKIEPFSVTPHKIIIESDIFVDTNRNKLTVLYTC